MEAKTTGEAYINTRKGKLIAGYELKVVLPFKAKRKKDEVMCEGTMEFPYVGDENADEDVEMEVRVATGTERALGDAAKQEILRVHRPKLVEEMNAFVEVLSKGGPALEKGATPQSVAKAAQTEKPAPAAKQEDPKREAKEKPKAAEGTKTIEFKEEFYCRPRDLYECYMDQGRVMAYTRSECRIVPVAGEPFTMFGGAITGVQVELVPEKRIVQRWRSSSWPEGVTSLVTMTFEEPSEGRTVLKLTQTGIPEEDAYGNANAAEVALQGWRQQIWGRVRQCFGYGC